VTSETPTLEELAGELEAVADKLRAEAIDAEEAADLVERCAELAQQITFPRVSVMVIIVLLNVAWMWNTGKCRTKKPYGAELYILKKKNIPIP
jgi:hypothetical protein